MQKRERKENRIILLQNKQHLRPYLQTSKFNLYIIMYELAITLYFFCLRQSNLLHYHLNNYFILC